MRIWYGYGAEHSANLVMIGRFKLAEDAESAKDIIDSLVKQVTADEHAGLIHLGEATDRYTDGVLKLLGEVNVGTIGPGEVEQFTYEVKVEVKGSELFITTEEVDVSAFFKILISKGARVEIYSAHDYPGTGHSRGG